MEIGPKVTALGRRRTFVVAKFDLGRRDMKVATINISSVKLHNPESPCPSTGDDGGERAASATTTTTGDTTITYPVFDQFFEVLAPDPFNDEAFRVTFAQTMDKTPVQNLSPLIEACGLVVGAVLSYVMDASTREIPTPLPLPRLIPLTRFLPVPLPTPPLPPIPDPFTQFPHSCYPGERTRTRSHSIGEKSNYHGRKWFEDHYCVKQNIHGPHPFRQYFLRTTIASQLTPGCEEVNTISHLVYFLLLFPANQPIWMTLHTSKKLVKHGENGTNKGGVI